MPRVVLVTGVSRELGARFARTLAARTPDGTDGSDAISVIGVDVLPPRHDLGQTRFVRADIRNPVIARVIERHQVDTVVHMAMVATPGSGGTRSSMKEMNVIGTMQLLAACQKAPTLRSLVVQSSISVYGASWRDPVRFTEEMSARVSPRTGFGKDSIEVESYVRGLARRRSDVSVTVLRLANLIGAGVDSGVTRLLAMPVVPRVMGFDPRLQFLHPDDAVSALSLVTSRPIAGTYNVGAPDIVTLNQVVRMLGRPWIGVPQQLAPTLASALRRARLMEFSADQLDALTFGRAMDVGRFTETFGFTPHWSSKEAVGDFVAAVRPGMFAAERWDGLLDALGSARQTGSHG